MKNHFFFPYSGNKRNEVENLLQYIESQQDFNNIETIIEPFCGSSALSYYISTKYPKKFKYVLNDMDKNLIDLYKLVKDERKFKKFNEELNKKVKLIINKEAYDLIKKENTFLSWFIIHKIYGIKPGLYKIDYKPQEYNLNDIPIVQFIKNEEIEYFNIEGEIILQKYKDNSNNFLFIDPPYVDCCNLFYSNTKTNIYEYACNNDINNMNAFVIFVLEDNWIMKLLFKDYIKQTYNKLYQATKRQTQHILISNK